MHRIFISYNRQDREKVFNIQNQIESALGEKCWIDVKDIENGGNFVIIRRSTVAL